MTYEEFLELNPCINNIIIGNKNSVLDRAKQREFLSNHTFIFAGLQGKQAEIIRYRYGLDDGICRTYQEIADIYGVTRGAVHDIEKRAMRRLGSRTYRELLMKFDDNSANITTVLEVLKRLDPKLLVNNCIKQAISEKTIRVVENVNINILNIRDFNKSSTRKKLINNGITTIKDLIYYLHINNDLSALDIKPNSYENIIFSIGDIIDSGSLTITSQEIFEEYSINKADYKELMSSVDALVEKKLIKPLTNRQNLGLKQQVKYSKIEEHKEQVKNSVSEHIGDINVMPIENLKLSYRLNNVFRRAGIDTIARLIDYYYNNDNSFKSIKCLGDTGELEVLSKLAKLGIELNEDSFGF